MSCSIGIGLATFIGLAFQIIGVFLMATRYTNVRVSQIAKVMITALWRGKAAREGAQITNYSVEDALSSLQGLAFIALGFIVQSGATFWPCGP